MASKLTFMCTGYSSPTLIALVIFHIMTLTYFYTLTFYSYFLLNVYISVKHQPLIKISFIFVHPIQLFLLLSSLIIKQCPVASKKLPDTNPRSCNDVDKNIVLVRALERVVSKNIV